MRCNHVIDRLDDFVDGELTPEEAAAVRAHLDLCPACSVQHDEIVALLSAASGLSQRIEPTSDLWPGIVRRIAHDAARRRHRTRRWVTAVAATAVLAVLLAAAYQLGRRSAPLPVALDASPDRTTAVRVAGHGDDVVAMTRDFENARDVLLGVIEARSDELSDATMAVVMDNLAVIDGAIARITEAVEQNPDDPRLAFRLASAYRSEIELLERAARLPAET